MAEHGISRNRSVTKSNDLIEASYRLTVTEQRVLLLVISQLDPRKPPEQTAHKHRICADDYAAVYGIELKHAYESLKDAVRTLYHRSIRTYEGQGRKRRNIIRDRRWIYEAAYLEDEGACELRFHPDIAPLLTALHRRFTSYDHAQIAELRSTYAIRLYEMLAQWRSTGELRITIEDLRHRLGLDDKYKRVSNFRDRVIRPAVRELQQKTSLEIDCDEIKRGRALVSLVFRFREKPQGDLFAE